MDAQVLNKIKEIIQEAESFAILLDNNPQEYEILSAEVLKRILFSKNIPFVKLPEIPTTAENKWSALFNFLQNSRFPSKTSIRLPKDKYGIKEIGYKEGEDEISLIITGGDKIISKEDLFLEPLQPEPEIIFAFFENPTKLKKFQNSIQIPKKEKIIFFTPNDQTLTEKIFSIAQALSPSLLKEAETNNLLFASLFSETDGFQKNSKAILTLAARLLEQGADREKIDKISRTEKSISTGQLLGRMLARTYIDETTDTSWSFLAGRDFQKTKQGGINDWALYKMQNQLKNLLQPQKFYVLLWQTEQGVKALISSKEKSEKKLEPIAQVAGGETQSHFLVMGPFENFSTAEIYVKQTLKKTNAIE